MCAHASSQCVDKNMQNGAALAKALHYALRFLGLKKHVNGIQARAQRHSSHAMHNASAAWCADRSM